MDAVDPIDGKQSLFSADCMNMHGCAALHKEPSYANSVSLVGAFLEIIAVCTSLQLPQDTQKRPCQAHVHN